MKDLDNFITGANNPHAPFNQVDLAESQWVPVLDICEWFTKAMYDDQTDKALMEEAMMNVEIFNMGSVWLSKRNKWNYIVSNKERLAQEVKDEYQRLKQLSMDTTSASTYKALLERAKQENLDEHLLNQVVTYLRNIRCTKYTESDRVRAKAHFKKLTQYTFEQYWNFLSNLNYNTNGPYS